MKENFSLRRSDMEKVKRKPTTKTKTSSSSAAVENVRFHALNPRRTDVADVTGIMAPGEGSRAAAAKATLSSAMMSHTDDLESDDEAARNTTGPLVPREWYADEDHIGYDLSGQRISKAQRGDAIDKFVKSASDPLAYKWTIYDEENDEEVVLSKRDVQIIKNLHNGTFAHPEFDPYSDDYNTTGLLTSEVEPHSLHSGTEPKRRFLPSRWEELRINSIVRAIRSGQYQRQKDLERKSKENSKPRVYLMWGDDGNAIGSALGGAVKGAPPPLPAPKLPPPGHAASYNPPSEYLFSDEEKAAWESSKPIDRPLDFIPRRLSSLRQVPAYEKLIKERFERCLDLYLAPRGLGRRDANVTPESLLPKLPDPTELKPFPNAIATTFLGHTGRVRSISTDPTGQYLASGGDDGVLRVWDISLGKLMRSWKLAKSDDGAIHSVAWGPNPAIQCIAACIGNRLVFVNPGTVTRFSCQTTFAILRVPEEENNEEGGEGEGESYTKSSKKAKKKTSDEEEKNESKEEEKDDDENTSSSSTPGLRMATWRNVVPVLSPEALLTKDTHGSIIDVDLPYPVKTVSWHRKGDYCVTVSPSAPVGAVMIHQLSRRDSQSPLKSNPGKVQCAAFHPRKARLFVANQRTVRVYDLLKEPVLLLQKLESGVQWISSMDVHPSGEHLIVGSYDHRVVWFDLDLSSSPYKTLRYHAQSVRRASFHQGGGYPLMASSSDDGSVHVFHARVFTGDYLQNPILVPVKILRGHTVGSDGLGVLDCVWHPQQPWLFSSGSDGKIILWQNLN